MKNSAMALAVGFIFALGLGLAGMTQPGKVVGFLDLFGQWDPSLMFVMVGAIAVHAITYRLIRNRPSPLLAATWQIPKSTQITKPLLAGSFLFGIGWGLAGFCPGPAITSLASFSATPVIFVFSMLAGMGLYRWVDRLAKFNR